MPKYIKKSFDFHWEELEQNVDQSVLYDIDAACIELAQEMGLNAKDYGDFRTIVYFKNVFKKLKHCDESIYTNTIVLQETELDYKKTDVTKV